MFASEMIGAVRGKDPDTGFFFDDTKRYVDAIGLSESDRHKIFEGTARKVFPRLDARLKKLEAHSPVKAEEMRLGPLLEGPRQYVVPYFQRAYSWRRRQWTTLFDDILELYELGSRNSHFLGSMVLLAENNEADPIPAHAGHRRPAAHRHAVALPSRHPRRGARRRRALRGPPPHRLPGQPGTRKASRSSPRMATAMRSSPSS